MRFAALVAILLSASVVDVRAQRAMPTIEIIEKGVYQAETIAQRVAPKSTGFVNSVKNIRLISNTTTVFAELGVRFGLRYEVLDTTVQHAPLKLIVRFPPAGLRNPQTGQTLFESEYTDHIPRGVPLYWEYQLESEWEMVPGLWQFEFWSDDNRLAVQRFCVIDLRRADSKGLDRPRDCSPALLGSARKQDWAGVAREEPLRLN
jgi:hypothetical protein